VSMMALLAYVIFWQPEFGTWVGRPTHETVPLESFDQNDLPLNVTPSLKEGKSVGEYLLNLEYRNSFSRELNNVKLSIIGESGEEIKSVVIVSDTGEKWRVQDGYLLSDQILSGETGELDLKISISNLSKQLKLKVTASYTSGEQSANQSFASNLIFIPATVALTANAYYYTSQGDQIGIGPLPPVVGLPTRYWILFDLGVANGDLENFALVATLPKEVKFTENRTLIVGEMSYNPGANQVLWKVPQLREGELAKAGFEVEVIPNEQQIGQVLNLVDKIVYNAKDSLFGQEISGSVAKIDTRLEKDSLATSDGQVIE